MLVGSKANTTHTMQLQSILRHVQPASRIRLRQGHASEDAQSRPRGRRPGPRSRRSARDLRQLRQEAPGLRHARRAPLRVRAALGHGRVPHLHDAPSRLPPVRRDRRDGAVGGGQVAGDARVHLVSRELGRRCCRGARPRDASAPPGTSSSEPSPMPFAGASSTAASTAFDPSASTSSRGKRDTSTSRSSTSSITVDGACCTSLASAPPRAFTASSTCSAKSAPGKSSSSPATCGRRSSASSASGAGSPCTCSTASTSCS